MTKILKWILREICVLSVIALLAWLYIIYKVDASHDILMTEESHDEPPSEEYYSAYDWVEWGSDNWIRNYSYDYNEKLEDFSWTFREIFTDSLISFIIKEPPTETEYYQALDSIEKDRFNTTYQMFDNSYSLAEKFFSARLRIRDIDTIGFKFLFDFTKKNHDTLSKFCIKWIPYLRFYYSKSCWCDETTGISDFCYDILSPEDRKKYFVRLF